MREALRNKRIELGLTQTEVAKKAEISQQCYNYIETGNRNPSIQVLKRIAKVLDITDINLF